METLDCEYCFVMVGINDDNRNRDEARNVLAYYVRGSLLVTRVCGI